MPTRTPVYASGPLAYTGVLSLAFSATGQVAAAGLDGTVRFRCSP